MFVNVSAWATAYGVASALDTLCSQSFTGSRDRTTIGVHLQRSYLILALMFIPIACVWWNATPIMLAFNQDPELAEYAGKFNYIIFRFSFFFFPKLNKPIITILIIKINP